LASGSCGRVVGGETVSVPYDFPKFFTEVVKPSDYPSGRSFVIQFFSTEQIHHEGDERSKRFPGHGYPAYTATVLSVRTFVTQDETTWRQGIEEAYRAQPGRTDFAAFSMDLAHVKTRLEVEIA
jgi:hypothetical protein